MATNNADNFSNPISVATGGTGVATFTTYAPLCGGTTSTAALQQATTGLSTTNAILTSQGASALPQWVTLAGGGTSLVKILTLTASASASLAFDSTSITSTYNIYLVTFRNIVLSNTTTGMFRMQVSTNNGSSYLTTGYQSGNINNNYNSTSRSVLSSTTVGYLSASLSSPSHTSGYMFLNLPQSAPMSYVGRSHYQAPTSSNYFFYGNNSGTTTINNIQFLPNTGTLTSGSITLYGITQ